MGARGKRAKVRAARRFLQFGQCHFRGRELATRSALVGHFGEDFVTEATQTYERERAARLHADSRRLAPFRRASWPAPTPSSTSRAPFVLWNLGHLSDDRLEQALRLYAGVTLIAFIGTARGFRTAPRGKQSWSDEASSIRRENWKGEYDVFDWGYSRAVRSESSNKSCGVLLAVHQDFFDGARIKYRSDPPRNFARRLGGVHFRARSWGLRLWSTRASWGLGK